MNNYKRNSEPWLQLLQKELKGKAMGELIFDLDDELKIDPVRSYLYNKVDIVAEIESTLPLTKHLQFLRIGKGFDQSSIMEALNAGVNGIYYSFEKDFELSELPKLLEKVEPSYITQFFDISSSNFTNRELQEVLGQTETKQVNYQIFKLEDILNLDFSHGNVVSGLTSLMAKIMNSEIKVIKISPHPEFFINAAAIRALRCILINLELSEFPQLVVRVGGLNDLNEDFNQSLIRYTSQAMSSILGGIEVLIFDSFGEDSEKQRLLRNIPNLLNLEASVNKGEDALAGSRNFEYMVDEISNAVWDKLKDL